MENASKALLIAGAVLIAVLVLTFGIYQYYRLEKVSESYSQKAEKEQILEFNSNFTIFQSRNESLGEITTAHDIVSVVNFARDYNLKGNFQVGNTYHVTVNVVGVPSGVYTRFETKSDEDQITFMDKYSINSSTGEKIKFTCTDKDITYDENGKVNSITFRYRG